MVRKFILLRSFVPILFALNSVIIPSDRLSQHLNEALTAIESHVEQPFRVAVMPICFEDTRIGGRLARYIQDEIGTIITNRNRFILIERDTVYQNEALAEIVDSMDDFHDDILRLKTGYFQNAQGLLYGHYWNANQNIRLVLKLFDVRTKNVLVQESVTIPKKDLPDGFPVIPQNLKDSLNRLKKVTDLTQGMQHEADFRVRVWTDRGDGATYREGEKIIFYVQANRNCYLRLFHVDPLGDVNVLYPREYSQDKDYIEANVRYAIPDQYQIENDFYFVAIPPFGTDIVKAVASTQPFTQPVIENYLGKYSNEHLRERLTRGIGTKSISKMAEDECVVTTVEKR